MTTDSAVTVASSDIGHIGMGDAARIKFDAFPFQEHGTVDGTVSAISENSFAKQPGEDPAGGAAYYRVRIALGDRELRDMPANSRLLQRNWLRGRHRYGGHAVFGAAVNEFVRIHQIDQRIALAVYHAHHPHVLEQK